MEGDFFSDNFDYVQIKFRVCDPEIETTCKEKSEIEAFLDQKAVQLIYTNTFVDSQDPEETLKVYVENRRYFNLDIRLE